MGDRLKILHISHSYWPATFFGGPIFSTLGLCEALASNPELELRVLSTDAAGPSVNNRLKVDAFPIRYNPGYQVYFVRQTAHNFAPRQVPWIWSQIKWADCILLTGTYSFHVLPTLIIARYFGKPVAWQPRGALLDSFRWSGHRRPYAKRLYEKICRLAVGSNTQFVVTSTEEAEASQARVKRIPTAIISNGISVPFALPKRNWKPGGKLRLMSIGRISPKKGLENLISAMALLGPEVSLNIYGRGEPSYENSLKNLSNDCNVSNRVNFLGQVDGAEKENAFTRSDIFILPTHSENFAMVVAEALAHGVPAIVSFGAPWSEINDKGVGLWISNTPESLAKGIQSLKECDLQKMGAKGREWMVNDFTWSSRGSELVNIFKTMSRHTSPRRLKTTVS